MDKTKYCWATAGYMGAIGSGQTTCGLLIGSMVAISLRHGQGKDCIPMADQTARGNAVKEVNALYRDFLKQFGASDCQVLTSVDFSKREDSVRYMEEKIYQTTCFKFFNFVMDRFVRIEQKKAMKN